MRVRFVISRKHPYGAVWIEGPHGWDLLPDCDVRLLGFPIKGIFEASAELSVHNDFAERLYSSADDPVPVLQRSDGCKTCG